jgi:PAS domain S-box-containing protein
MLEHLEHTLSTSGFMPHGMCYLWKPGLLALHVISDALITLAYFSIPFTLLYFVRKRRDLEFNWMFVCFAIFIIACGTTHLMEIVTVWKPEYWLSGTIKAITAAASVPTAILLAKLIPEALAIPSPSSLRREVAERQRAELEVRKVNEQLEARVAERTAELEAINLKLREEMRQRQEAEERSRTNQALLEAVIDHSPAVIYVKQLDGRYLLANRLYERIFKLQPGAMVGRTDYDLFDKASADRFRAMDQRVIAADKALSAEEAAPQPGGLHHYISVKAPLRDAAGKAYAVMGISTDITERKLIEEQLRTQLAHLSLLDQTTRAIGERLDLRSIFMIVLRSVEEHLNIDLAFIGMHETEGRGMRISAMSPRSLQFATPQALREETPLEVDTQLSRTLGTELVYEPDAASSPSPLLQKLARVGLTDVVSVPLVVASKPFGVLICARRAGTRFTSADCEFLRQLTQHLSLAAHQAQLYDSLQRAYEDLRKSQQVVLQQERLRALGQMASGIAHDINNALSPASLYAQTLLERNPPLDHTARSQLAIVQRSLDDVANTVARMREFYRPRDGQREHTSVDINLQLREVAELTRARWSDMPQERGVYIELRTELDEAVPSISGADSEIRDAVTNLVLNAVDAMPEGGVLTIRSRLDAATQRVAVEVSDDGQGMTEDVRARCLEPFFTTKGERGTGLGLAMVYGMAQRHGAILQIESRLEQGTTVRLLFAPAGAQAAAPASAAAPATELRSLRILLIDDDPLLLDSVRHSLEADGHEITTANGGQEGIDAFAAAQAGPAPFEFVITDLGMPHVDGRTVAAAIKSRSPRTPVVMLTGWGQRLMAEGGVPAHVDRVLSKPPKLGELRAVLGELA